MWSRSPCTSLRRDLGVSPGPGEGLEAKGSGPGGVKRPTLKFKGSLICFCPVLGHRLFPLHVKKVGIGRFFLS